MTDLAARVARSALVGYCPNAEMYEEPYVAGMECDECMYGDHKLRKRRGLICSRCQQVEWTQKGFNAHECFSAA